VRAWAAALLGCALMGCTGKACVHRPRVTPSAASPRSEGDPIVVPRAAVPLVPPEADDDPEWHKAAIAGPFHEPGSSAPARPYSDARFLADDERLYVLLYAADEDIQAASRERDSPLWRADAFALRFASPDGQGPVHAIDVAPNGAISDARIDDDGRIDPSYDAGLTVSVDVDGSIDDASGDDDEEWVVRLAIPRANLPFVGPRLRVAIVRCDTPRSGGRRCGQWGGAVTGRPTGEIVLSD
jgi:hypothetical protein